MTEWRILAAGIRAFGWLFLIRGLADSYTFTPFISGNGAPRPAILVVNAIRVVVALALIRNASRFAARLADAPADCALDEDRAWNRWLIVTVFAYGLATTLPETVFQIAQTAALASTAGVDEYGRAAGLIAVVCVVVPLLALKAVLVQRDSRPLTGEETYDNRP